jgi:integrase
LCHQTGIDPDGFIRRAKNDPAALRDVLGAYASEVQASGKKAAYVAKTFDTLRSWLRFNSVDAGRNLFPRLSGRRNETLENERTPTQDELRQLLGALSPRGRVVALLMAHSGLRPGAIANVDGTDGLRLDDLPELRLDGEPRFQRVPFVIRVRSATSKNSRSYLTFGSPELAEAILVMLRERQSKGDELRSSSPLVASLGAGVSKSGKGPKGAGGFVATKSISLDLRDAIRRVRPGGQTFRPYCLRSYFSTQLLIAESKGLAIHDAREAMLGHDLGVSGRYNLSRKLPEHVIEELRAMYERSLPLLTAIPASPATSNEEIFRFLLERAGVDPSEITALGTLTSAKVMKKLREIDEASQTATSTVMPGTQKVVDATAVEAWIAKGWRFVSPLNGSKAIVESPRSD